MILRHRISFLLLTVCLLFLPSAASAVDIVSELTLSLSTDSACYKPGSTVKFTADGDLPSGKEVYVRYRHNNTFIEKHTFTSKTWTWTAPDTDYMGYMVDLYYMEWKGDIGTEHIIGAIAVDVSSDWKRFPRYGFVADFDNYGGSIDKNANIEAEMKYLNRLHINGVQFQDWHWKHHRPVKFENNKFVEWYQDISNRWVGTEYVKKYIEVQHRYGMKSIFYNLCYGAWKNYEDDSVSPEWGLYKKDANGNLYQDFHVLPSNWQSNIYLMNPGNEDWQKYLMDRNNEVYENYAFDGYQVDQLGDPKADVFEKKGTNIDGTKIDLQLNYRHFLKAMKGHRKDKRLVMNCIGDFGTHDICDAKLDDGTRAVDFCYNELWSDHANFSDLFQVIQDNDRESEHNYQTVFAAYINYDKADHAWDYEDKNVNTPGALLTDAVMFAIGGSHLEMGDHMLTREYFPAKPLAMTKELKERLVHYYDFMTAYQNILRGIDSKAAFTPTIRSSTHPINAWPPQEYKITAFAKKVDNMIAVHLLNFRNTNDLSWRDLEGTRPAPEKLENVQITYTTSRHITKVWTATPDKNGGVPMELSFTQTGNDVSVTVPSLEYWTMLVFEGKEEEENMYIIGDAMGTWDLKDAKEMVRSTDGRTFSMTVHLEAGKQFKFVNGKDYNTNYSYYAEYKNFEFKSGYNSANLLVSKSTVAYSDYKFTVSETGDYYVTLDLNNMRIYVNKAAKLYDKLYVIGDATQAKWDLTKAIPLTKSENGFEYSGTCLIISDGTKEFKFVTNTANNWNQDQFVKGATENDIVKYDGNIDHDYKWVFSKEQSGNYKITVNLNTMRVTFTKLESKVYLCDGAFGVGSWENYTTEMKRKVADDVFTYTFKTGNWNETEKKEYKYLRFKIVNGDFSDIYAPSGDNNVSLTAGTFATVPVDNNTTPNPSAGDEARSWSFETKPNTTYTIMVKNVNSGGYYYDKGLAIAYFEEPTYDKAASGGNPQLVVPGNSLDGTKFVQCGGAYWYLDVDLSGNSGDFNFKFYSPKDKEYIGAYNHQMNTIDNLSFTQFYWGNNELGPNDNNYDGRNLLYTLPAAKAKGKVRINLWKVGKDSKTGETTWKFYVANNENHDNITYYMVLNGKRYAMSPTRERIGNRNVLRTVWSLNLQDFQLKGINNGEFGYYIESSDGKKYSCHAINAYYPLGLKAGLADYYPNSTSHAEGGDFEGNYSNDAGNVARYERYDDMQVNGEVEFKFSSKAMESYGGKSVTWIFNPGRGYTLTALINKSNFGGTEAATGYSIVGNLNAADKYSSDPFSIHMQLPAYQRKLTKYWYKGGRLYDREQAAADSIVYRVTVNRPANGWKTDGYTIVVFDNATLKTAETSADVTPLWKNAIRPQEEWLHPYSGQKDYTGVNATALKGGLYTRRKDANGNIIQTDDVQQMISFTPQGESFTFSLNTTTSTYLITDNKRLYILGPAVGVNDNDREREGWSTADAEKQTSHAYPLVYDSTLRCYCYKGADGNGDEQPVPMAANRGFAFAWDKSFANLSFCEDNTVPRVLVDATGTSSTEAMEYQSTTGSNGRNETQYVNWLQPCRNLSDTYDASVVKACNFGLPTQFGLSTHKGTGYYIRLYVSPDNSGDDTAMPTGAFYTIRRTYTFSTPIDPKNPVGDYKTFKTFSDYYAVVLPDGVDALYVDNANKQKHTVTLKTYPLLWIGEKRVLPAGAAVILATKNGATSGKSGEIVKTDMSFDYHSDPTFAEVGYGSKPAYNMLKSQITRTKLPYAASGGNSYNYLFSFQQHWDSDQKKTIGFFRAGAANNPVNTAYLQIDKSFYEAAAKGWSLSFDFNDATGIRQPEIVDGGGDCYTLQGIRVKKPAAKGIYIVNGKKVIR